MPSYQVVIPRVVILIGHERAAIHLEFGISLFRFSAFAKDAGSSGGFSFRYTITQSSLTKEFDLAYSPSH